MPVQGAPAGTISSSMSVSSGKARDHDVVQHRADHLGLPAAGQPVIAAVDADHEVEVREDEELLAAPADAAEPWLHALRRADRMLAEIPVIAVAPSVRQHDFGCQRLAQPVDRYDLLVLPLAAAEHELADLQH